MLGSEVNLIAAQGWGIAPSGKVLGRLATHYHGHKLQGYCVMWLVWSCSLPDRQIRNQEHVGARLELAWPVSLGPPSSDISKKPAERGRAFRLCGLASPGIL